MAFLLLFLDKNTSLFIVLGIRISYDSCKSISLSSSSLTLTLKSYKLCMTPLKSCVKVMPKNTQHLQKYGHTNKARPFGARECAIFWSVTDVERRLLPIHISNVYTTSNLLVSGWINVCLSIMCVWVSVCVYMCPQTGWPATEQKHTHTETNAPLLPLY